MVVLLKKADAETSTEYGYLPHKRPIELLIEYGIVIVDKPRGPSSHQCVTWVKNILRARKAGHSGTLDPKVSGVLPVALNSATRAIELIAHSRKVYVALMQLHRNITQERLEEVLKEFTGEIYQMPPVRSKVKRRVRKKKIYSIELLEFSDRHALLKFDVEAGVYIRKLCHDIGDVLGCGAHMKELRRLNVGKFSEEDAWIMQDIVDAYEFYTMGEERYIRKVVKPFEILFEEMPKVILRDSAVDAIAHGAKLAIPGIVSVSEDVKKGNRVAMMTMKGEAIATGIAEMDAIDILKQNCGIAISPDKVFMKPGIYPKCWEKKYYAQ